MITLTEAAATKILKELEGRKSGAGIKIGVKTTGCSGLAYVLEFCDSEYESHTKIQDKSVSIFVDDKSIPYITGTTIDYVQEKFLSGFKFLNPNERDSCGCGESFRV
jgi:iron-sulfur cluster assembly protein